MNIEDHLFDMSKTIRRISDAIIEEIDKECIHGFRKEDNIGQEKLDKMKKILLANEISDTLL